MLMDVLELFKTTVASLKHESGSVFARLDGQKKRALNPDGSRCSACCQGGKAEGRSRAGSALVSRSHKSPSALRSLVNSGPWEGSKDQSVLKADLEVSQP